MAFQLLSVADLPSSGGRGPDRVAVRVARLAERPRLDELQRARERVAERPGVESHPPARPIEQRAAAVDLRLEIRLACPGRFQLVIGHAPQVRVEARLLDAAGQPVDVAVTDAGGEALFHVVVDHLGQAAQLLPNGLGLADQHFENLIFLSLRQHEVVAANFAGRLQLAVDPAVALLDAARIPREVEVEEVGAVGLEIESLAGGVGGQKNAERIAGGGSVEPSLDLLAARAGGEAVDGRDAIPGPIGGGDRRLEHRAEVALRAFAVLREDQDAPFVPARRLRAGGRCLAERREPRAAVFANPVDQPARLGLRPPARRLGDRLHSVEQLLLPATERRRRGRPASRHPLGRRRDRLHLPCFLRVGLVRRPLGAFIVGAGGPGEQRAFQSG